MNVLIAGERYSSRCMGLGLKSEKKLLVGEQLLLNQSDGTAEASVQTALEISVVQQLQASWSTGSSIALLLFPLFVS